MSEPRPYTVVKVLSREQKPGKYGLMQDVRMNLQGAGIVSWWTKAETLIPEEGSTLYGTVEESEYGLKFKKASGQVQGQGSFGGSPRPEDPERNKRIVRQHSQTTAIETLKVAQAAGVELPIASASDVVRMVKTLASAYDADVFAQTNGADPTQAALERSEAGL